MVFDRYRPNSIKGVTRAKRKRRKSKGIRRDVESRGQRIGNWDRFIVVEEDKASVAHFLSTECHNVMERILDVIWWLAEG